MADSSTSQMTATASVESTVSEFLESKLSEYEIEKWYTTCLAMVLEKMMHSGKLTTADFLEEVHHILKRYRTASTNLKLLNDQRILLQENISEEVNISRMRFGGPVDSLAEQSYMSNILLGVINATKRTKMKSFDQKTFNKSVTQHYSLRSLVGHYNPKSWAHHLGFCHLWGDRNPWDIKAAHIVPKFLSAPEISHLLGNIDANDAKEPSNGKGAPWQFMSTGLTHLCSALAHSNT